MLENTDNLGESSEIDLEIARDLGLVVAELGIKVLAVWTSAHGGAEDGLDEEAVVRLEGAAVGGAEGVSKLLIGLGRVGGQGEAGKLKSTDKPEETLSGSVLLSLQFVAAEVLDVLGLEGRGKLAIAEFLDVANHVVLDWRESDGSKGVKDGRQRLRSLEEFGGGNSATIRLINGNIDKGLLEGLHNGATRRDNGSGHDCFGGEGCSVF